MVRRSQTSNPRSAVVLTSGADWGIRAAGQRRSSGAELPIPRRKNAKVKALQQTIELARTAINKERWHQARYELSRARALVNALPAREAAEQRDQLALLRKKFAARNTPAAHAARSAKKAKRKPGAARGRSTQSRARSAGKPKNPARELGDRPIDRGSLGYAPADEA